MPKHKQVFRGSWAEAPVLKTQCYSSFTSFWARFPGKQGHIAGLIPLLVHIPCLQALVPSPRRRSTAKPTASGSKTSATQSILVKARQVLSQKRSPR